MKQYIHVTKETRQKLMKIFGCTERMVFYALQFDEKKGNSDLAKKIRKAAYENYGILMNVIPALETLHDHDNYMRQYLPNGAVLEFNKNNGDGDVYIHGKCVRHYENLFWSDIEGIQNWAMTLR